MIRGRLRFGSNERASIWLEPNGSGLRSLVQRNGCEAVAPFELMYTYCTDLTASGRVPIFLRAAGGYCGCVAKEQTILDFVELGCGFGSGGGGGSTCATGQGSLQ